MKHPSAFIKKNLIKGYCHILILKVKNQITKVIKEEILGPVNAPIFKLNQKYRCRLLLRSKKNILIQKKLAKILKKIKIYSGIKLTVDVDPISFN